MFELERTMNPEQTPQAAPETSSQPPRCTGVNKDGQRCKASIALVDGLCSIHRGRMTGAMGGKGKARAYHERKRARQQEVERGKMTLAERLALEAAQEQDALISALFAPLHSGTAQEAHRAALAILERMLGRPTERLEVESAEKPPSLDDLLAAWTAGTESVPGGELERMHTGVEE